jgi:cell shape-determining protein MreC
MYSIFAMLYITYLLYIAPPKELKKLKQCEKNIKQLEDENKILKRFFNISNSDLNM